MNFHTIHYTQIIWEEVALIWKVTGKAVAIFMTSTVLETFKRQLWHKFEKVWYYASCIMNIHVL